MANLATAAILLLAIAPMVSAEPFEDAPPNCEESTCILVECSEGSCRYYVCIEGETGARGNVSAGAFSNGCFPPGTPPA